MNHQGTKAPSKVQSQAATIPAELDHVASVVVDCAYRVHRALGPGLLESVYEVCLTHELKQLGCVVQTQLRLPVEYGGIKLDAGLRLDMLVDGCLIVEIKAVEELAEVHKAQLLTYLKLTGHRLGLLINFNVPTIKAGIKRIAL